MTVDKARTARAYEFLQRDHPHFVDVRYTPTATAASPATRSISAPAILTSVPIETDDRTGRRTVLKMARSDAERLTQGQRLTTQSPHNDTPDSWSVNYVQDDGTIFSEVLLGP